ncbi:MAG: hypothetical protein ACLGIM_07695, partial [Alphaproteobacteria bacterium]
HADGLASLRAKGEGTRYPSLKATGRHVYDGRYGSKPPRIQGAPSKVDTLFTEYRRGQSILVIS